MMERREDILNFLRKNYRYLKENYHIEKIGLFGSFARNQQNINSDVDIIIELEPNTKNIYDLKQSLKSYLSKEFGRKVDIAREKYIKPYAKKYILKDTIYV